MMPDVAKRHGKDKQHEERYWDDHVPNWLARIHGTDSGNDPLERYLYDIADAAIHQ